MIIYNVTTRVDAAIEPGWLSWLKEEHIPQILETNCFTSVNILELLELDDEDGATYAIQYHAPSKAMYNRYIERFSRLMTQRSVERWGNQFVSFPTVMQVVE